jgi:pre-60S factor REI1
MASTAASAHPFTCNTCQVAFRSSDLQRTHMQSDWHRYNLKRRVASLPPLTSEIFAEKVLANKASAAATAARASFEKKCDPCDKVFFSEGAFVNHVGSQKHKNAAARYGKYTKPFGDQATETESMTGSTFSLGEPLETGSALEEMEDEEMDEVAERMNASGLQEAKNPVFGKNQGQNNAMDVEQPSGASGVMGTDAANKMEIDEDYEHEADVNQCLFCNYVSPTMDLNVNHMGKQHGWFVPEMEFLVDMKGLINYLSETIQVLHQCLYCHKQVHTSAGVQTHMRDRGHCMIAYSTEDEQMDVGEFYDFRATYEESDTDEDEETEGGVNLGKKRATKTTITNENGEEETDSEDDEGWESDGSDDDDSSVATDEITSVPVDRKPRKPSQKDGKHKNSDGYHSHAHSTSQNAYRDDFELHLPSGRTAGHRSLRTYYRQNLHNYPTPEQRLEQQLLANERHDSDDEDAAADVDENGKQIVRSGRDRKGRALVTRGKLGMVGVSDEKKKEIAAVEKRQLKRIQRQQAQYQWGNDKRGNSQKHFRDPLLQ